MQEHKECDKCTNKKTCKDAYKQIGSYKGKSVLPGVIAAFLIPLIVFAVSLSIFENIFENYFRSQALTIGLSVSVAFTTAFLSVLLIKLAGYIYRKIRGIKINA